MTKQLTYSQQLKHPNWQRRRLEILNRDEFVCQCCYDSESTLHVHHKRYVKGRMPWEYSDDELVTLCEDCHEQFHQTTDDFKAIAARLPVDGPGCLGNALGLLAGWATGFQGLNFSSVYAEEPHHYLLGQIAGQLMSGLRTPMLADFSEALNNAPEWVVKAVMSEAITQLTANKDAPPPANWREFQQGLEDL